MVNAPTNIGAFIARIGEGITVRAQQQEQDAVIRAKLSTPERALAIEMPCGAGKTFVLIYAGVRWVLTQPPGAEEKPGFVYVCHSKALQVQAYADARRACEAYGLKAFVLFGLSTYACADRVRLLAESIDHPHRMGGVLSDLTREQRVRAVGHVNALCTSQSQDWPSAERLKNVCQKSLLSTFDGFVPDAEAAANRVMSAISGALCVCNDALKQKGFRGDDLELRCRACPSAAVRFEARKADILIANVATVATSYAKGATGHFRSRLAAFDESHTIVENSTALYEADSESLDCEADRDKVRAWREQGSTLFAGPSAMWAPTSRSGGTWHAVDEETGVLGFDIDRASKEFVRAFACCVPLASMDAVIEALDTEHQRNKRVAEGMAREVINSVEDALCDLGDGVTDDDAASEIQRVAPLALRRTLPGHHSLEPLCSACVGLSNAHWDVRKKEKEFARHGALGVAFEDAKRDLALAKARKVLKDGELQRDLRKALYDEDGAFASAVSVPPTDVHALHDHIRAISNVATAKAHRTELQVARRLLHAVNITKLGVSGLPRWDESAHEHEIDPREFAPVATALKVRLELTDAGKARVLREALFDQMDNKPLFMSATLRDDTLSFDSFFRSIGMDTSVPSPISAWTNTPPFNLPAQLRIFLQHTVDKRPRVSHPNMNAWIDAQACVVAARVRDTPRATLLIDTNQRYVERLAHRVCALVREGGTTGSRAIEYDSAAFHEFSARGPGAHDAAVVVYGTKKLSTGVNLPGRLSLNVITKVPNGVRLPVQEYSEKLEKWRRDGVGSAWDAYFFRTLTALRQAIGRLIRCHSDAGDVLILEVDSNAAHRVDRWMNTFFPGVQLEEC